MSSEVISGMTVLRVPMQQNDANADTIGAYLIRLGHECWLEGEGFDGKRPFGNSGWEYDVLEALVRANLIYGELDDGCLLDIDEKTGNELIAKAFQALYDLVKPTQLGLF